MMKSAAGVTCAGTRARCRHAAALGLAIVAICFTLNASGAAAGDTAAGPRSPADLSRLTIEELADIDVSSVSKKAEPLGDAPAAIYVITRQDIHRYGSTSIPEILRLAPNLQVARVDSNRYAITARGFNSTSANKLLVLIDGRSVYTPLFSGVFWDVQDVFIEDIERIEVISGPGGALWGSNAVNGVINIITRHSRDTTGGLVSIDAGTEELGAGVRYGGKIGEEATYRTAFPSPDSAVNLCVVGDDPFGVTLDKAASEEKIGARAIAIRRLQTVGRDSGCHILYIGSSESERGGQIIEAVHGSGVLTVSDTSRPDTAVGIVNFVIRNNRVRFDIDQEAAAQNGLTISSRLLSLALTVKARR